MLLVALAGFSQNPLVLVQKGCLIHSTLCLLLSSLLTSPASHASSIFYSHCTNKAKLTSLYCLPRLHLLLENSLISVNEAKMTEEDKDPEHSESKNEKGGGE